MSRWAPTPESMAAYQWFAERWGPAAAAGIVGNLVNESGMQLDPRTVHDQGTGLGVAGHRNERRAAMLKWAEQQGLDPYQRETQYGFIDHELKTSEKGVGDRLRGISDPAAAAATFIDFERPGGWKPGDPTGANGYQNRVNAALALGGAPQATSQPAPPDWSQQFKSGSPPPPPDWAQQMPQPQMPATPATDVAAAPGIFDKLSGDKLSGILGMLGQQDQSSQQAVQANQQAVMQGQAARQQYAAQRQPLLTAILQQWSGRF